MGRLHPSKLAAPGHLVGGDNTGCFLAPGWLVQSDRLSGDVNWKTDSPLCQRLNRTLDRPGK